MAISRDESELMNWQEIVDRMGDALMFYADPNNWRDRNGGPPQAEMDGGGYARDVLKETEKIKNRKYDDYN